MSPQSSFTNSYRARLASHFRSQAFRLEGLNAEPSQITDFTGFTALAYFAGTATGSDGSQYNLESDIRVMEGEYVGEDGRRHEGTFAEF